MIIHREPDMSDPLGNEPLELAVVELRGGMAEMGEQFGEATRVETRQLYERRLRAALTFARAEGQRFDTDGALGIAHKCLAITQAYDPAGYEEFCGIARGADLSPQQLYIMQGLTDFRDLLAGGGGCSSLIVTGDRTGDGQTLVGQTWDLMTDNLPFVRFVHRRPTDGGPQTWSLTLTGCLTLIGLSSEGIAVGNTNLRTSDVRLGVQYLSVLHRAIRSRTLGEALAAVRDAPRSAAHYYYLADAKGEGVGLECSATRCAELRPREGTLVHCNHALSPDVSALEIEATTASTTCRQRRVGQLLGAAGRVDVAAVKTLFSDHDGGDNAICRHDLPPNHITTNACVIMRPQSGEIHACRGPAHLGIWRTAKP
jgi:isopenicillin-N N-acyltransferase-like protein